jgi:hypothetical protein
MFVVVNMACHYSAIIEALNMVNIIQKILHISTVLHAPNKIGSTSSKIQGHLEDKDLIIGTSTTQATSNICLNSHILISIINVIMFLMT